MARFKKYGNALVLVALGFLTRFFYLGFPNQVVFDEMHYGKFASWYLTHSHFFDIHPPLSKLLGALAAYLGNFDPHFDFGFIGETFTDPHYWYLRVIPALCGMLLPLVVYLLAQEMGISKRGALVAGLLVVFENSLLVQSKFMLIDGELIFFGFTSLLLYLYFRRLSKSAYLLWSALFLGAAISTKWTGVAFLAICLGIELASYIHDKKRRHAAHLATLIIVPAIFYIATFYVHFSLLTNPGQGDPFMSQGFLQKGFTEKFLELNEEMFLQNKNLSAGHAYASKWYTWPILQRPIYYWEGGEAKIYSIGNPFIYLVSTIAIIILFLHLLKRSRLFFARRHAILFILAGYAINFFPYMLLHRITFLYYYLAALVFAILAAVLLIDTIEDKKLQKNLFYTVVIISVLLFFYFAPFTYGIEMSSKAQQEHFWLSSWR